LVLGTAAPASHCSDSSMTPFPQTADTFFEALGGKMGVFDREFSDSVLEAVPD